MFQDFTSQAAPEQGPARLQMLRELMQAEGLQGFIIPRADAWQGEYVADCDARLEWLTGFTGSAGFAIALTDRAGVFIDGRYRTQVKAQVDLTAFTPVPWPEVKPGEWLLASGAKGEIGFDPWLHTEAEITQIIKSLAGSDLSLRPCRNLVDAIWTDRPAPPCGQIFFHPEALAGKTSLQKRAELAEALRTSGEKNAVITLPDSICWLLNIRGADVPKNPVVQGFAFLRDDGHVTLFTDPAKISPKIRSSFDAGVTLAAIKDFETALSALAGPVRVDAGSAPLAVSSLLIAAGTQVRFGDEPCRLPKACKNPAEIAATREAHLRDGAAMVSFLGWLERSAPGDLTEIAVTRRLEEFRRATNALHDISFDTICGAGPNGAIIHYKVNHDTDRKLQNNELLLVDSGAQYVDGTTDITRTIALGDPGPEARICYTAVLRGMIAISRARWPRGLAGRDLDPLARQHLWSMGLDYDHGTGHGVGAFLSVHEGPQRISRISEVPLEPGMILSNEPGYYREGAFGIRLENLIVVTPATRMGDNRDQLSFETLTWTPFDRRLILADQMSQSERDWLNDYHAQVLEKLSPRLTPEDLAWAKSACAPL